MYVTSVVVADPCVVMTLLQAHQGRVRIDDDHHD